MFFICQLSNAVAFGRSSCLQWSSESLCVCITYVRYVFALMCSVRFISSVCFLGVFCSDCGALFVSACIAHLAPGHFMRLCIATMRSFVSPFFSLAVAFILFRSFFSSVSCCFYSIGCMSYCENFARAFIPSRFYGYGFFCFGVLARFLFCSAGQRGKL